MTRVQRRQFDPKGTSPWMTSLEPRQFVTNTCCAIRALPQHQLKQPHWVTGWGKHSINSRTRWLLRGLTSSGIKYFCSFVHGAQPTRPDPSPELLFSLDAPTQQLFKLNQTFTLPCRALSGRQLERIHTQWTCAIGKPVSWIISPQREKAELMRKLVAKFS